MDSDDDLFASSSSQPISLSHPSSHELYEPSSLSLSPGTQPSVSSFDPNICLRCISRIFELLLLLVPGNVPVLLFSIREIRGNRGSLSTDRACGSSLGRISFQIYVSYILQMSVNPVLSPLTLPQSTVCSRSIFNTSAYIISLN